MPDSKKNLNDKARRARLLREVESFYDQLDIAGERFARAHAEDAVKARRDATVIYLMTVDYWLISLGFDTRRRAPGIYLIERLIDVGRGRSPDIFAPPRKPQGGRPGKNITKRRAIAMASAAITVVAAKDKLEMSVASRLVASRLRKAKILTKGSNKVGVSDGEWLFNQRKSLLTKHGDEDFFDLYVVMRAWDDADAIIAAIIRQIPKGSM